MAVGSDYLNGFIHPFLPVSKKHNAAYKSEKLLLPRMLSLFQTSGLCFQCFLLLKLSLKLQVLESSHGVEAVCPLKAEHLQSGGEMYILYSQLSFGFTIRSLD